MGIKHLISFEDWIIDDISSLLQLSMDMKRERYNKKWSNYLLNKIFLMIFYNPSLRTRLSFETGITELGGHGIFWSPEMGWIKNQYHKGESLQDAANVISRFASGVGIRITLDAITKYGEGNKFLQEYARHSSIPIINMADDMSHPCQAISDLLGWYEYLFKDDVIFNPKKLKGRKVLFTWGKSDLARPWSTVQSHLLLAARYGMNVALARPDGYDLDLNIYSKVKQYCNKANTDFSIISNSEDGYDNTDIVYVRNWVSPFAYNNNFFQKKEESEKAMKFIDWIVTAKKMARTNNAAFTNPMPIDRDNEATNEVINSCNSIMYNVAENRLHTQKAIMSYLLHN